MKEIIRADKQLIVTTIHYYKTHSIYHAHYATAFLEVLEVVAGSFRRVHAQVILEHYLVERCVTYYLVGL